MGKTWDSWVPGPEVWREVYRVLKPGAYIACFAGSRTHDLMSIALRMAGFECRDTVMWVYGSGFPKSLDVSKAIDKLHGAEREVIQQVRVKGGGMEHINRSNHKEHEYRPGDYQKGENILDITAPATEDAKQWQGFGTALKPAFEPILLFRKPLVGTVAQNVLQFGTGGLNIDGCRIPTEDSLGGGMVSMGRPKVAEGWDRPWMHDEEVIKAKKIESAKKVEQAQVLGRGPANLIHDGSEEVINTFPDAKGQQGDLKNHSNTRESPNAIFGVMAAAKDHLKRNDNSTSAARFFYCAKTSKTDRNEGCDNLSDQQYSHDGRGTPIDNAYQRNSSSSKNNHSTVKPTDLMAYVCRLITPPGGTVLDPFMGSGSTGKACAKESFGFIGIEQEESYFNIAKARIEQAYFGDLC